MYTIYCSNQPHAALHLQTLTSGRSFRNFLDECHSSPLTRSLDIASFLIKPVQRICKYPLLIKAIIKSTPANHPDYHILDQALKKIESVVSDVNEGTRQSEGIREMLSIIQAFEPVISHRI